MAVNVTVRDIFNFPGGTAKTVTVDVIQIVPKGEAEGDERWVASATTTATASGGGAIQNVFKNEMKRGFIKSSGLKGGLFTISASTKMVVAIDEAVGSGVEITLDTGTNLLGSDVAKDLESKIQAQAVIGGGGAKIGDLSYLNAQVRFEDNRFIIESGTVSDRFTGANRSSVAVGAPSSGTDARTVLGFDIVFSSETLAARQLVNTEITATYTTGTVLTVSSTAGLAAGDAVQVVHTNGTYTQTVVVSGLYSGGVGFVTASGASTNLSSTIPAGSMLRKLHPLDVADPVSAIDTVDELYRFCIDSIVNQINFNS